MNKMSHAAARNKAVANVIATLRIEQLSPSAQVVEGLHGCVAGETTTGKLIKEVLDRHVKVRRD
jgi:hypothetical protein